MYVGIGVLSAATNAAQYLECGHLVKVSGELLLRHGRASSRFPTLRLEALPNRDSLQYRELYGVPHVHSICRGTLRYEGSDDDDVIGVLCLYELLDYHH